MKEKLIAEVMQAMLQYLDNAKLVQLKQVLEHTVSMYEVSKNECLEEKENDNNLRLNHFFCVMARS